MKPVSKNNNLKPVFFHREMKGNLFKRVFRDNNNGDNMFRLGERNLIEINGSLLVTLPITWVRHNTLGKGQRISIDLDESSGALVIAPVRACEGTQT